MTTNRFTPSQPKKIHKRPHIQAKKGKGSTSRPVNEDITEDRLTALQRKEFNKSSFNNPVSAKQAKDLITPLVFDIANGKVSDEDGEKRVFVALPRVIAILECKDISEDTLAQPVTTNEIRQHWGEVSAAIRINNIPFSIEVTGSEKKVLFYRALDTVVYADTWVDNYFKEKYKKNDKEKYERDIANLASRVKTIVKKLDVLEKGTQDSNIMLHALKREDHDIKSMLEQLGATIPEKISVVKINDSAPSDNFCIVTLNIGLDFRMDPLPPPNQNFWGIYSLPKKDRKYSDPKGLRQDEIMEILTSLYDCDDERLFKCLKENPDIKKYIEEFL